MIVHKIKVYPSKVHLPKKNQLAWKIAEIASDNTKLNQKAVDMVISFKETTPLRTIKMIKPDYLFKGSDYKKEKISGYNFLKKYGGRVIIIKRIKNFSTTSIINKKKND